MLKELIKEVWQANLDPHKISIADYICDKHYKRKDGPEAYYRQKQLISGNE